MACSVVSSTALDRVAAHHGVQVRRTLSGFKWIIRSAIDEPELEYVLGYEEALGFATSSLVRDKDGITAAIITSELSAELSAQGLDLLDRLDTIAMRDGLVATRPVSIRYDGDASIVADIMSTLRRTSPKNIGGRSVQLVDWALADQAADILEFDLGPPGRILIRPSGTEPKIKAYIELISERPGDIETERESLRLALSDLSDAVRDLLRT